MILGFVQVAEMPNVNRWLKKREIDYLTMTAGKYKRTLTPMSEVTEEGKAKFQEDLNAIHVTFKDYVAEHRGGCSFASFVIMLVSLPRRGGGA
jgi:serine protease SohB